MMNTNTNLRQTRTLELILNDVRNLRPMPFSVSQVLSALDDPSATVTNVSEMIGIDQALTAEVLKMANSALLGYGPQCSTIKEAVMRIGFSQIRSLVLGAATIGPLTRRLSGYRLEPGQLWHHALETASGALALAKRLSYPQPETAYVAGLLHDLGKLVLDQYMHREYRQAIKLMRNQEFQVWQVEERIFGAGHGTVGGLMATQWRFPVELVDAIRFHHAPSFARTRQDLAAIVNVANALTPGCMNGLETGRERAVHPESLQILGLYEAALPSIKAEAERLFEQRLGAMDSLTY